MNARILLSFGMDRRNTRLGRGKLVIDSEGNAFTEETLVHNSSIKRSRGKSDPLILPSDGFPITPSVPHDVKLGPHSPKRTTQPHLGRRQSSNQTAEVLDLARRTAKDLHNKHKLRLVKYPSQPQGTAWRLTEPRRWVPPNEGLKAGFLSPETNPMIPESLEEVGNQPGQRRLAR